MIIFNLHTLCLTLYYYTYHNYPPFTYTVSHSILYMPWLSSIYIHCVSLYTIHTMIIFNLHTLCLTLYYTYHDYLQFTYTVSHSILYIPWLSSIYIHCVSLYTIHTMIIFNLHTLCLTLYYTYQDYLPFTYTVSHSILYCCALTKRSISQNFQNTFFGIIHISPTISILCQKILAENCLQCTFFGYIKTLYPIFRVRFDNQNTLSNLRVYNTSNSADIHYFKI